MSSQIFSLSDKFLSQYQGKQPNWGYGDLSLIVYKRTYSRLKDDGTKEEFFDTVKRVVEGCFQLQLDHCIKSGLPWEAAKAQRSAQKMFEKIWQFKFLPPGRGLWMMGAPIVQKIGSAALNNCAVISSKNIKKNLGEPFSWACDMLMLGVGVGFSCEGAGSVTIQEPLGEPITEVIEDSREGWVKSIQSLVDSYKGNQQPVIFDYSKIRASGLPIKGFGGVSSGADPLIEGHKSIRKVLSKLDGKPITAVAITDIMDIIGRLVVSGNVRRSALLSMGSSTDIDFISMKDPELYKEELLDYRWAANNSVSYSPGDDLSFITKSIEKNGEPGLIMLDNARHYGRFKDGFNPISSPKYDPVDTCNPCIPNYSKFLTMDKGIVPLTNLEVGDTVWTGQRWAKLSKKWSTGIKPVYRYTTSRGYSIDCTQDHKLITTSGKVIAQEAEDVLITPPTSNRHGVSYAKSKATLAGLVQGDGSKQKNGGTCAYLNVGEKDKGYYGDLIPFVEKIIPKSNEHCELWKLDLDFDDLYIDYEPLPQRIISDFWMKVDSETTCAFLRGLYSANGCVIANARVALKTTCRELAGQVQLLLSSVGIRSYITTNKPTEVTFSNGTYTCKESYDVNTSDTNTFMDKIGFLQSYKAISRKSKNQGKDYTDIVSESYIEDMEVWDFTVDAPEHSAWVNGVIISNCAEQFLTHGELCTLVETFPANHDSIEEFLDTVKYAYLYAKSVTLLPTHSQLSNSVMLRNRRIGLSQSGVQQAIKKFGYQSYFNQFCNEAYGKINHWDMIYSRWLGIPQSIKMTTLKPSGTVSLLAGATPGVHCTHSEFYLRTIRIAANDALIPELERAGYRIEIAVTDNKKVQGLLKSPYHLDIDTIPVAWDEITPYEKDLIKKESITLVVYFPVQEANFTKSKYDISLWEQMMLVKELQHVWSDNAVSCTITFKPEEAKDLESAINYFSRYTKSLSFLPLTDHNYAQAPYQTIDKTEYDEYVSRLKPLNSSNSSSEIAGAKYCDAEGCTI